MFELLDSVVKEIGEKHVVEIITNKTSNYIVSSRILEEKRKKIILVFLCSLLS